MVDAQKEYPRLEKERGGGGGEAKGKQIGCLQRSSVRRPRNLVPSDAVGKTMATRGPESERETDGEICSPSLRLKTEQIGEAIHFPEPGGNFRML